MTYAEFLEACKDRYSGRPFNGLRRRGWAKVGRAPDFQVRMERRGAGGRVVAVEGDDMWKADTLAEWLAQWGANDNPAEVDTDSIGGLH